MSSKYDNYGCFAISVLIVICLGIGLAINGLLAWGLLWCVKEMFKYDLPYWPTVVFLMIVSAVVGAARSSGD